jgi:transcriptional regulator with XRE-family HTH domain
MTRLRQLRTERGWSGFDLARHARVNQSDISAIELGRKIPPADSPMLRRLARALKWSGEPSDLLAEVGTDAGES